MTVFHKQELVPNNSNNHNFFPNKMPRWMVLDNRLEDANILFNFWKINGQKSHTTTGSTVPVHSPTQNGKMAAQPRERTVSVVVTVCKCRKKRFRSNRVDLTNNCNNPRTKEVSCCDCMKKCNECLVLCVQKCVDKQTWQWPQYYLTDWLTY